jgi:ATP-dependent protease HslVU (ClpYQ) peptidase subunit
MTTISWDGRSMAADKQMNTGNMKHQHVGSKIRRGTYREAPALYGGSGTTVFFSAVIDWLMAGEPPDHRPELPGSEDTFTVIVATPSGVFEYIDSLRPIFLGDITWAIGSGAEYAFGAMDAGACAKRAVEIACGRDCSSGMGIDVLTLKRKT